MRVKWDQADIQTEEISAAIKSLQSGIGARGDQISLVEERFKKLLGCKDAVLVNNGTSALIAAFMGILHLYPDIKTVGVPSFTFIASYFSALFAGLKVELLDCNPLTWNVAEQNIPRNIDLTLLVDVGGLPCDYDTFLNKSHLCIADSAESLGSKVDKVLVGSQLPVHTFSFQRSKIITCGEGGLVVINDERISEFVRSFINHGYDQDKKSHEYIHRQMGLNFRICDVEAAILNVQLDKLEGYVKHRNRIAEIYKSGLGNRFVFQEIPENMQSNYFLFGILVEEKWRDKFTEHLIGKGIEVKCWKAVHEQSLTTKYSLPNAAALSRKNILLPIHNCLTDLEVEYIIDACNNF